MKFRRCTADALRAMVDLALHESQGPIPVAAIAKRQGMTTLSLAQLLHKLRRAGLVIAERGARGGYTLSRSPAKISVADVIQTFEDSGRRKPRTDAAVDQATALVWTRIEVAVSTTLATTTLAELAAEARRRHTSHTVHHSFTFHI